MTDMARSYWRDMSLSTRIVLVMLILLLVVQAAGGAVVRAAVEQLVRQGVRTELEVGERVWQRLLDLRAQRLQEASVVLAADFGFRSAIASGDQGTIASALDNSSARIGATLAVMLSPDFTQSTVSEGAPPVPHEVFQHLGTQLSRVPQGGRLARIGPQPYQFVMVPVKAPVLIGWVLMGFPLDQGLAEDFVRLSNVHIAIVSEQPDQTLVPVVSTLPRAQQAALVDVVRQRLSSVTLGEDILAVRQGAMGATDGAMRAIFLRSISEARGPYQQLQFHLILITLGGLLLFAVGSHLASRRVTRPLKELTEVTGVLEQGRFDIAVQGTHRHDEVGQLARGFDRMRTSLAQQHEQILKLAYWDRLTGLPNREQFRDRLVAALDQAGQGPLVVLTLNLDRFKHVNEVLGYGFGDELLKVVATRLQQHVGAAADLVARVGGDEFVILLTQADAQAALAVADRITRGFEHPLALGEQTVDLSASIGAACWPGDGDDADTLMSRSEVAMHAAKARTTGVVLYAPALDSSSAQTLSLLSDLRHALAHEELRLYLQPKLHTASGQISAAEALVRWQHPERGLVPPMAFIPFAEQTGFVRQLTLWVFEEVARQWSSLQSAEAGLRVAINLSTRDLLDLDFPQKLSAIMARHGVQAEAFCLEITESAIMDDPQRAENTLNRLAELGFKLSIDDFGTGYSSLAYLKRLPVSELKIDKSFVMGMADDDSDAKIVRSTIDLAHNLGLSVVAEGVETEAILQRLRDWRCDEAQGYLVSKPMPAADFIAWRQRWQRR
ncbi:putative bifunctional diguanylate cyclase/phosphodiesterase [Aquabacterium sp.]|uniref:putative bifunctional diguanylate cyclase/phosphodiesterase n=1 Tax=Aquabacterium sp. TaxID=1872578 RepID=UPI003B6DC3BD